MTTDRYRYLNNARLIRLPMLLPAALTAWDGRLAVVVDVEERVLDSGKWAVRLNTAGVEHAVSGPAEAELPVFTDPYQVCSCHGEPWPCNDAYAALQEARQKQAHDYADLHQCHACHQTGNLGRYRSSYPESRRYCRRVACVREAERWEREVHNARYVESRARTDFAEQMRNAMGGAE